MLNQYQFDIVVLSETWLKDNKQLLQYVQIPDYPVRFSQHEHRFLP